MSHDTKDGYTKIANSLLNYFSKCPMSGASFRIVFWVFRNSYGYKRKNTRPIAVRDLCKEIEMGGVGATCTALKTLIDNKIIIKNEAGELFLNAKNMPLFPDFKEHKAFPKRNACSQNGTGASVPKTEHFVPKTEHFVPKTEQTIYIRSKENSKDNLKERGEGRGNIKSPPRLAPSASPLLAAGQFPEADILAVAGAYAEAKGVKFADQVGRTAYLKMRKVYYGAKDLLAQAQGNVKRATAAIIDHAAHYKRNEKPDWKFEWILEDFYKWDEARIQNEKEE